MRPRRLAAILWLGWSVVASGREIVVAPGGSGDVTTVQAAIAEVPSHSARRTVIRILPGRYEGPFVVPIDKQNLTLCGQDLAQTVLTWDRNVRDPKPAGVDGFNPALQIKADGCYLANLTIENTSGDRGQGVAVRVDGDRDLFVDCRITGWQDTLMVNNGRDYFQNCYISGRVDFIFGSATVWFQNCEIHSRNGGHVTAASTPREHPYGLVFDHCTLTGDSTPWNPATTSPTTAQKPRVTPLADLGRPWRPFASVTYLDCDMGAHISPAGWNNWGQMSNESTARYAEFHSTGPGGRADERCAWTRQLTDEQAKAITLESVLGDNDWQPKKIADGLVIRPSLEIDPAEAP